MYCSSRSRPRADCAYSPTGATSLDSTDPPVETLRNEYTLPVEKATIRECRKRSATVAGRYVFIAQVSHSDPVVPNLRAAIKITFGQSGNSASDLLFSRSHEIVWIPAASSKVRAAGLLNRATAITRVRLPDSSIAR